MQPYYFPRVVGPASAMSLTTTLTDIPGMSVNVAAGGWYIVNAWVQFTTTGTSASVGFALGGTAGEIAPTAYSVRIRNATNDGANTQVSAVIPGAATASNVIATAGTYAALLDGLIVVGTAGTLTVSARIGAATASIPANNVAMLVQQIA